MRKKAPLYKWLILLLIPLIGIAFILYRKVTHHPTIFEQIIPHENLSQPEIQSEEEMTQEDEQEENKFFDYSQPEEEVIEPQEETSHIEQPEKIEIKKPQHVQATKEPKSPPRLQQKIEKNEIKSQEEIVAKQIKKEIRLTTELDKKALGYKHWTGRYYPSKWVLKFDGKTVLTFNGKQFTPLAKSISIDPNKPVKVRFDFEFLGGKRKGWKEVTYRIDKNADVIKIDFDWKDPKDDQILISPAKALSQKGDHNHKGKE